MRRRTLASQAWQELKSTEDAEQNAAQDVESNGERSKQCPRVCWCDLWPACKLKNPDQAAKNRNERIDQDEAKDDPL